MRDSGTEQAIKDKLVELCPKRAGVPGAAAAAAAAAADPRGRGMDYGIDAPPLVQLTEHTRFRNTPKGVTYSFKT